MEQKYLSFLYPVRKCEEAAREVGVRISPEEALLKIEGVLRVRTL